MGHDIFNYFSLSALVNAITSIFLGLFIIITNYQQRVARFLFYFCMSVAAWSFPYFIWQISQDAVSALFWVRMLMFGAIFTSITYFHMVLVFLKLEQKKSFRYLLFFFYLLSAVWCLLNATDLFVQGVEPKDGFAYWPTPGPYYIYFLLTFAVHVILASFLLFRADKNTKKRSLKVQIRLLLIGIFVAFVGGSTNYPLWYDISIPPWGNGLVTVYVILTVYSIMRYGFLDLKVVAAEIFAGLSIIVFFLQTLLAVSRSEFTFQLITLAVVSLTGIMLVRSVRKEVRRSGEIQHLANSLEKANVKLQELDRTKTEFLSIASHQLRTPLSIIKGYIELIKDGAYGKVSKKTKGVLEDMDESNERLVKLVDEFLDITRIEQGRTKFVFKEENINDIIESCVKELTERALQKNLSLVWKRSKTLGIKVILDSEKVRHVIFNFIDNAIKYSEKGEITITLSSEKNGISLRVRDEGLGFNKEDEGNFFQKFYRGKNVEGTNVTGTGLGIYVCRKFIEAHTGYVWAKSPGLNKGSEFGFWLPFTGPGESSIQIKDETSTEQQKIINQYGSEQK
ncbi:MAG: hypothetical protein COV59_01435 [Candidatus Magasanikbacteria bacterium CG11_big_fil_rev_8_21_14_0_20_39_34]|uniref:histidine kinase n=1 Tax=Candidatus Magasanikbacteria bacterium CG11_big_fil_rev_8_21_14_0_20_39_34 TaxID=1974653 RepID=A0A2H0N5U7_9BACT|nr:MAG: hypothetical protein COV59_01435 [Candidatus Magasanikbacteria bacterium CG11_big_fil_rev_8_21_14_0_20_39_34]